MPEEYARTWEQVTMTPQGGTLRMKVPGGWLVKDLVISNGKREGTALLYYPDDTWTWVLEAKG